MNLHLLTTLIIVLGLVLTLSCMVEVSARYRQKRRTLERYRVKDEDSSEQNGG